MTIQNQNSPITASNLVPTVIGNVQGQEKAFDIFSRLLCDRIITISGEISQATSDLVVPQLLYLDSLSSEKITIYINSPGGCVSDGLAIIDCMKHLRSKVETIVLGQACSMGAMILAAGDKGLRKAYPHAEIMIHEPSAGTKGRHSDMKVAMEWGARIGSLLADLLVEYTGQPKEEILQKWEKDMYFTPKEALAYGVIDEILTPPVKES